MTAIVLSLKRQAVRTIESPRRLFVVVVVLMLIAAAGLVTLMQSTPQAIQYPQRFLSPTPVAVCPGETFTYPVSIAIDRGDSVSRITEGWCHPGGICPRAFQMPAYYVNFLDPYEVSATATRDVPLDLPPGDWEFRHCNETHSTGLIDVTCYAVIVTVKDCSP